MFRSHTIRHDGPGRLLATVVAVFDRSYRVVGCVLGASIVAIGLVVMYGWRTDRMGLVVLGFGGPAMRFNTAVLAVACGVALIALVLRRYAVMQIVGGAVAIAAATSGVQNLLGQNFGIDELFQRNSQTGASLAGAKMSLNAAMCFMLLGISFVAVRHPGRQNWRYFLTALLASAASAVAIVDFLGILTELTTTLGWAGTYGMSVPSAIVINIVSLSLLAVAARYQTHQGTLSKWFPLIVGNAAIIGTLVLWLALQFQDYERVRGVVHSQFENLNGSLTYSLRHHEGVVTRIAKRWNVAGGTEEVAWREDAKSYLDALQGYVALAWIDAKLKVERVEQHRPLSIAATIAVEPAIDAAILSARSSGKAVAVSAPRAANAGDVWLIQPLLDRGIDDGCLLAIIDLQRLMPGIIQQTGLDGSLLKVCDGQEVLYDSGRLQEGYDQALAQSATLRFANQSWDLTAIPTRAWVDGQRSTLPDVTLGVGLLFSLLLTASLRLAMWARDSYRQSQISEASFRAIFDNADRSIIAVSPNGTIHAFNSAAERMLGYSAEEMIDKHTPEILHDGAEIEARAAELSTQLGRVIAPGFEVFALSALEGLSDREWTYVRKDGSRFPALLSVTALRDAQGGITGYMGIANDVTQQRRAQRELEEARHAAEQANRAKSEFLANMSHEIRTPMNGIIGMTELALLTPLNADQKEYLDVIRESADSLLTVVNDILDFSKVEAGMLALDEMDFDLRTKMNAVAQVLGVKAQEKGLELICHIEPEVPAWVVGDPDRLRQVVVNLLGNAIKFTERGEVNLSVALQEAPSQDCGECLLHFAVTDTGIGIPPDKQILIFDAFAQADNSTTRRFGGTGLGLSISARLVALMGGQIWVESSPGHGSIFHFTARFKVADSRGPSVRSEQLVALENMRVLVVDDHATNRLVLHDMLINWKMSPTLTSGGREALAVAGAAAHRGEPYRLILVDYLMPDMDGIALIQQIQGDPALQDAKIVMLTSVSDRIHSDRCKELNIAGFLRKPLNQSTLLDELLDALSVRGSEGSESADFVAAETVKSPARTLNILLVEDNRINQRVAMRMLSLQGHRVCLAESGKLALQKLAQARFDAVLMDLQMPDMDGFETTAALRSTEQGTGRHMPVIAMTAHALKGDRERCLAAGMDGYVSKPVKAEELQEALMAVTPVEEVPPRFDFDAALERVGGDLAFLMELATMLREDAPQGLTEICTALEAHDALRLEKAAHRLKGSLTPFCASAARDLAQSLETAGHGGSFETAADDYRQLVVQINELLAALAELRSASSSTGAAADVQQDVFYLGDRSCTA